MAKTLSPELVQLAHAMHVIHEALAAGYDLPEMTDEERAKFFVDDTPKADTAMPVVVQPAPTSEPVAAEPTDEELQTQVNKLSADQEEQPEPQGAA
jgi:hypothetical protein